MRRISSKYGSNAERYGQDSDDRDAILDSGTSNTIRARGRYSDWDGNWFHYVDAWDFSFFSTELLKHYEALKIHVFEELANLNLTSISGLRRDYIYEYYTFEITNLPSETSKIYQLALKHLNQDDPQIPIKIESLKNKLKENNDSVTNLKKDLDNLIDQKPTSNETNEYHFHRDNLYKLLSIIWEPQIKSESLQQRIDHFIKTQSSTRYDEQNQFFYFGGSVLGHGTKQQFDQMKADVFDIVSNVELVKQVGAIQDNEKDLNYKINEIKKLIDPIIKLIDQGLYETKIKKCCPTFWSLIKKYR